MQLEVQVAELLLQELVGGDDDLQVADHVRGDVLGLLHAVAGEGDAERAQGAQADATPGEEVSHDGLEKDLDDLTDDAVTDAEARGQLAGELGLTHAAL